MSREFKDFSVDELQGYYSDFHKDFYGFRPRFAMELNSWNDHAFLVGAINHIHDHMDMLKETFEGREQLREQGWTIEEPDLELAQQAVWLAQEREREQAEAMAELDATYYGVA